MEHPVAIHPRDHAVSSPDRMGKSTIFRSERVMVGLNAFEPGQEHALHAHAGMNKVCHVIEGANEVALAAGGSRLSITGRSHTRVIPGCITRCKMRRVQDL